MSPTMTRLRQGSGGQARDATRAGVIMGTAAYMSPSKRRARRSMLAPTSSPSSSHGPKHKNACIAFVRSPSWCSTNGWSRFGASGPSVWTRSSATWTKCLTYRRRKDSSDEEIRSDEGRLSTRDGGRRRGSNRRQPFYARLRPTAKTSAEQGLAGADRSGPPA